MKLEEFKKCVRCGQGMMHKGIPVFYRLKIQRFGIKGDAVREMQALTTTLGGKLAQVMTSQPELAEPISEEIEAFICETCSTELVMLAAIAEKAAEDTHN